MLKGVIKETGSVSYLASNFSFQSPKMTAVHQPGEKGECFLGKSAFVLKDSPFLVLVLGQSYVKWLLVAKEAGNSSILLLNLHITERQERD